MKFGVSLAWTTSLPKTLVKNSSIVETKSLFVWGETIISTNFIYLGGLKICVIKNLLKKSSGKFSDKLSKDNPEVLDEIYWGSNYNIDCGPGTDNEDICNRIEGCKYTDYGDGLMLYFNQTLT